MYFSKLAQAKRAVIFFTFSHFLFRRSRNRLAIAFKPNKLQNSPNRKENRYRAGLSFQQQQKKNSTVDLCLSGISLLFSDQTNEPWNHNDKRFARLESLYKNQITAPRTDNTGSQGYWVFFLCTFTAYSTCIKKAWIVQK